MHNSAAPNWTYGLYRKPCRTVCLPSSSCSPDTIGCVCSICLCWDGRATNYTHCRWAIWASMIRRKSIIAEWFANICAIAFSTVHSFWFSSSSICTGMWTGSLTQITVRGVQWHLNRIVRPIFIRLFLFCFSNFLVWSMHCWRVTQSEGTRMMRSSPNSEISAKVSNRLIELVSFTLNDTSSNIYLYLFIYLQYFPKSILCVIMYWSDLQ